MSNMEERREWMAQRETFNAERIRLAAGYVDGLTLEEMAVAYAKHMPTAEKIRKRQPLTGREYHSGMAEPKRKNLLLFQWRAWHAADEPGKSEALIAWESYE